ncbi:MFS transporter [Aliikangiella coralliicola]|uniref:MFS transporter n=1 Tax=Aliikangiella coralliicola TaxID=2592383 RepID=A0A545U688_9GAMM|nr:MFS transporter [Aliikangiella coralliicola]TQV84976.1 MFS transporter [Aliikangiella coralliicola]
MIQLNKGRINLLLSTAAFTISSAGSVLLHIVFAMAIYKETGSGLLTSLFVSLQWLPMLIVILYRSDWDHGMEPRKRWYLLDFGCAVLTLPILFFTSDHAYLPIVVLLLLRGIIEQVNRINKTVAARTLFPADKVTHYASFMQTGYHLGIGIAAVLGIFLASRLELSLVVLIDAVTFVIAAVLILITYNLAPQSESEKEATPRRKVSERVKEYVDALSSNKKLFFCAILPPITATFFQGTYSVLQPIYPIEGLKLDASAVSASYVLASLAIVAGSSAFSLFCKQTKLFERDFRMTRHLTIALSIVAFTVYVLSVWIKIPIFAAVFFTAMVFIFEFIWMMGYSGIVTFAPKGQLGSIFGISFSIGCLLASVIATILGGLLDYFGNDFVKTTLLFMSAYLLIIFASNAIYKRLYQSSSSDLSQKVFAE